MGVRNRPRLWRRRGIVACLAVIAGLVLSGLAGRWCLYSTISAVSPDGTLEARVTGASLAGALILGLPIWYTPIRTRVEVVDRTTGRRSAILTYPEWDFLGDGAHEHWALLWHPDSRRFLYTCVENAPAYYLTIGYRVDGDPPVPQGIEAGDWVTDVLRPELISADPRRQLRAMQVARRLSSWLALCDRLPADPFVARPKHDANCTAEDPCRDPACPRYHPTRNALGWTDRGLHVRVSVEDESPARARDGRSLLKADGLWLALRAGAEAGEGNPTRVYAFVLTPDGSRAYTGARADRMSGPLASQQTGLRFRITRHTEECLRFRNSTDIVDATCWKTTYEVGLPWAELGYARCPGVGGRVATALVVHRVGEPANEWLPWLGGDDPSRGSSG